MKFCFNAFEKDLIPVLEDCKYIQIPFEITDVYKEINVFLTKSAEVFFQDKINADDLERSLEYSKLVLDITWEKMNTGHWKYINPNWRYAYSFASIFKVLCLLIKKETSRIDIIKACDLGLLMGAPLMKNILSRIASKLSNVDVYHFTKPIPQRKKLKSSSLQEIFIQTPVKEEISISNETFYVKYVEQSCPVVLVGTISDWAALSSKPWSVEYILNKTRYRTVPVEIGSKYTDDSWTQKLMTVEDFVVKYIYNKDDQSEIGYLAQHNLFDQIPELFEDLGLPPYIKTNEDVDVNIWFGPGGTISPLHYDPKNNLLSQVMGEKYIRLYLESESEYLYPKENTWLSNTSQVDVENPDLDSFPLFSKASYQECILKPGQVLFIPPKCWHFVKSLSTSLSISFWW